MDNYSFDIKDYLRDLEHIVNIDSGTKNIAGLNTVAKFIGNKFIDMGWRVKTHTSEGAGPCLEITNTERDTYDVMLIGHIDTVFPDGTAQERPFTILGERAYGPGVNDMKSGVLLGYYALKTIPQEKQPSICYIINSDEETGSRTSIELIERIAKKSKYVFVLEGAEPDGAIIRERKGVRGYHAYFYGIAAHAGVEPEKGKSAIGELGNWIVELDRLTDLEKGTTLNVGVVSGGTASNVVAERAYANIDLRFRSMAELARVEHVMEYMIRHPKIPGVKVELIKRAMRPPMNATEATDKLCKIVESIGEAIDLEIKWSLNGGGSDANNTADLGVPTLDGLGPVGGFPHSVREYLDISSVPPRLQLLKRLILKVSSI